MKFPNFQEFLNALAPEKIERIMLDAKEKCEEASCMGSGEQMAAISWTVSLELLALYHLWLEEALRDD